jgi:hypothetical protein
LSTKFTTVTSPISSTSSRLLRGGCPDINQNSPKDTSSPAGATLKSPCIINRIITGIIIKLKDFMGKSSQKAST